MLLMNFQRQSHRIQKRVQSIQRQLSQLGPMRPGCLSLQFRKPKQKTGAFYQLSYTYQMKSKSEYIPQELVSQIQPELAEFKRYRELTAEWIDLCIELSRLKIKHWKETHLLH